MSEQGENPEEFPDSLQDFAETIFGGVEKAQEFLSQLEDPQVEAWKGIHAVFNGLLSGGFSRTNAVDVTASYIYRIMASLEETD